MRFVHNLSYSKISKNPLSYILVPWVSCYKSQLICLENLLIFMKLDPVQQFVIFIQEMDDIYSIQILKCISNQPYNVTNGNQC